VQKEGGRRGSLGGYGSGLRDLVCAMGDHTREEALGMSGDIEALHPTVSRQSRWWEFSARSLSCR